MNYEKFLPIGTVVMLEGGKKRVMITGFLTSSNNDKNIVYDYSGCLYPEGILSSEQTLVFNHDKIKEVHFIGFMDNEEKKFKEKLEQLILKSDKEKELEGEVETSTDVSNKVEEITFEDIV